MEGGATTGAALLGDAASEPIAAPTATPTVAPRSTPARPRRRPHLLSVGLGLVVLVLVGLFVALGNDALNHNERRLTSLQTKLTASSLGIAPVDVERRLGPVVELAAAGDLHGATSAATGSVGSPGPFDDLELFHMVGGRSIRVARLGHRLVVPIGPAQRTAIAGEAPRKATLVLRWLPRSAAQAFAYAMSASGPAGSYVVLAEQALPASRHVALPPGNPNAPMNVAVYFGRRVVPSRLIETNAPTLPLTGGVETAPVPFGTGVLTVVEAPSTPLVGTLTRDTRWIVAGVGVKLAVGVAAVAEHLLRRRQHSEAAWRSERAVSLSLQHSLLPEALPEMPSVELEARYVPATEGLDVGGDWYDAVALPGRRLFFSVGDVCGHGLAAAKTMAAVRHAMRAGALNGEPPEAVLGHTSTVLAYERPTEFATALCGILELASGRLVLASAGHLPPVLLSDGGAIHVAMPIGRPLGVGELAYEATDLSLAPGSTLLAYTDGLVERRDEAIDVGLARLRQVAGALVPGDPLDHLIDGLVAGKPTDDVAVLAVQLSASAAVVGNAGR